MTKDEALQIAWEALVYINEGANNQGPHTGISWRCAANKSAEALNTIKTIKAQPEERYTYGTPLLDAMVGCPPCNNHCNQGRTCPSRETRKTATPVLYKEFDAAYAEYKANYFDIGLYAGKHIGKEIPHQIDPPNPTRNEVLEEVAKEFDKMPFGDTASSFATFVRNMKT